MNAGSWPRRDNRRVAGRGGEKPIGKSHAFVEALRLAETVAPTDSTVLITGESGTGKEVVARYIHRISERRAGPFVSINCGALPESLLESELFGHVKGSFTGAVRDKNGLLAAAKAGTFLLDEVGEMSPASQVRFLRTLQEREVVPVGATEPVPIDVRIIAATNRDLERETRGGTFRSDLYYRLNIITLHLPPLRERTEDIALLAECFLDGLSSRPRCANGRALRLGPDVLAALERHDWPGNVRELENALERAAVLSSGDVIDVAALPGQVREPRRAPLISEKPPATPTLDLIERAYIRWVLEAEGGNKARAAEVLGIDPSTLYRKLHRYGMSE